MNQLKQNLAEFWSARDVRERKMLILAAIVVALVLIYAALIAPALTGREHLHKKLPVLREQVVQMQALSKEVASYGEQTLPVVAPLSKHAVESALIRHGLKAQSLAVAGIF